MSVKAPGLCGDGDGAAGSLGAWEAATARMMGHQAGGVGGQSGLGIQCVNGASLSMRL